MAKEPSRLCVEEVCICLSDCPLSLGEDKFKTVMIYFVLKLTYCHCSTLTLLYGMLTDYYVYQHTRYTVFCWT
jgi:hypothetical protein